jgi:dCMP deaminase
MVNGWSGNNHSKRKIQILTCGSCGDEFETKHPVKSKDGIWRCKNCNKRSNEFHTKLTDAEYNEMFLNQGGVCAICKKPEFRKMRGSDAVRKLCVDHDHETGKVRALLCGHCNTAIGMLKENVSTLINAKVYLQKHSDKIPSWDQYFMDLALLASTRSKDPSTKVGAILVKNKRIVSTGYNGMPFMVDDTIPERWERPDKYNFVIHAEANAIAFANGVRDLDVVYTTLFPCTSCACLLIQTGVKEIVYDTKINPRFEREFAISKQMFDESNVKVRPFDRSC